MGRITISSSSGFSGVIRSFDEPSTINAYLNGRIQGRIQCEWSGGTYSYHTPESPVRLTANANQLSGSLSGHISGSNIRMVQSITGSCYLQTDDSIVNMTINNTTVSLGEGSTVLVHGSVAGAKGNVVEGKNSVFYIVQSFSGSVQSIDTVVNNDMPLELRELKDAAGQAYVNSGSIATLYVSESIIKQSTSQVPEYIYSKTTKAFPTIGDIVFDTDGQTRVVSSKIYCPELNETMEVDEYGCIVKTEFDQDEIQP